MNTQGALERERKLVTVLFSGLSGYTAMSEKLDPEKVREIMSRIFGEIDCVTASYEGFMGFQDTRSMLRPDCKTSPGMEKFLRAMIRTMRYPTPHPPCCSGRLKMDCLIHSILPSGLQAVFRSGGEHSLRSLSLFCL